ncbi:hypothetical protein FRC06_000026 [Ceratobasidium sp. 370]|nr:hypothetical protein FRC06_000026 [Ceratobasidium sp. 370]
MSSTRALALATRPAFDHDDDSDVEIIEDSEPEREERREQERAEKRRLQRAVPSSGLEPTPKSTPWPAPPTQPTQFTSSASSSVVSSKPPGDVSQVLPSPHVTYSAPVRQVAPPPWLASKDTPVPDSPVRPASNSPQRTKSSSQSSPVKQLDINSFVFHKRTGGARCSTSSRPMSSSKATDVEAPGPSKVVPAPSAKASSSSKTFHLSATNKSSSTDATFSSEQIASLASCVVCSNSWTVRKQAKSKWSHITVCARKHGCGVESLHLKLVAAIVEASEEKARKAAKGKEKYDESPAPQSLLAHTVQERALPKRRGRRKASGPSSLLSVEEAQKSILRRSTLLLGTGVPPRDENEPKSTILNQEPESEGDHPDIPATQVFAPSKIGGHSRFFGSTTSMLNTDSTSGLLYADEARLFASGSRAGSPACSPSLSLTNSHNVHAYASPSPPGSPPLSINSSIISIDSSYDNSASDGLEILDDRARSPARSDSDSVLILDPPIPGLGRNTSLASDERSLGDDDEWDSRDGVYLWEDYVENEIEQPVSPTDLLADGLIALTIRESQGETAGTKYYGQSQSSRRFSRCFQGQTIPTKDSESPKKGTKSPPRPRSPSHPPTSKPASKTRGKRSGSSAPPLPTAATSKSKPKPKPSSPRPLKKRAKKNTVVYAPEDIQDDEEESAPSENIDAQLLAMITSDEALYLRILRYEPIKFEDLLGMAVARGIPKRGLQIRLKSFLDSQCINFYSGDNSERRKRY